MRALFLVGSALMCLALSSAGCTISEHERCSTVTIKDKFYTYTPSVNPIFSDDPDFGTYKYFIITQSGETSRATKDVYSSVFANSTYSLEGGYVGDCIGNWCKNDGDEWGYVAILIRSGS